MKRLIWTCTPGPFVRRGSFGGYADRLKGMVAAALLAERSGRDFVIEWSRAPRIQDWFECGRAMELGPSGDVQLFHAIDLLTTEQDVERLLGNIRECTAETVYLMANQFAEEHCRILGNGALGETFANVLSGLLFPSPRLLTECGSYLDVFGTHRVIGLHVRTNDRGWDRHGLWTVPEMDRVCAIVNADPAEAVFVASDSPEWKNRFRLHYASAGAKSVMGLDELPVHIDRSLITPAGFRAVVMEHFLLSQCAAVFVGQGGFGRTAAWWGRIPCIELPL